MKLGALNFSSGGSLPIRPGLLSALSLPARLSANDPPGLLVQLDKGEYFISAFPRYATG
jgi:hypothetical protein